MRVKKTAKRRWRGRLIGDFHANDSAPSSPMKKKKR
jgi:hypothetical protein